ncbi:MAG TPA: hypothetical protein H9875_06810 [Candidatus Levilactobacillus faecigallinarum]|uniref:Uncharacterized protein n=1 Tax=Candidatus Levilactobacillus faecigallinarum TaxID=2838638 RepID=A0A9D1QUF0_9LACO|nr:hypothetical protein [Candidatus Levilactobacillus faecigallinarum]
MSSQNDDEKLIDILEQLSVLGMPNEIKESPKFKQLWQFYSGADDVRYAPISSFVYKTENYETNVFQTALKVAVDGTMLNKQHTEIARRHIYKMLDHLELAGIQKANLADKQEAQLIAQKKQLDQMADELEEKENQLTTLREQTEVLTKKNDKMVFDFVTILGIFTSITFATFGGLQLLGNVFGHTKNYDNRTVGSEIMLGALFLFGTYIILVSLLTGLSKLIEREYGMTQTIRLFVIISISLIFAIGFLYTDEDNVNALLSWLSHGWHSVVFLVGILLVIAGICILDALLRVVIDKLFRLFRCKNQNDH